MTSSRHDAHSPHGASHRRPGRSPLPRIWSRRGEIPRCDRIGFDSAVLLVVALLAVPCSTLAQTTTNTEGAIAELRQLIADQRAALDCQARIIDEQGQTLAALQRRVEGATTAPAAAGTQSPVPQRPTSLYGCRWSPLLHLPAMVVSAGEFPDPPALCDAVPRHGRTNRGAAGGGRLLAIQPARSRQPAECRDQWHRVFHVRARLGHQQGGVATIDIRAARAPRVGGDRQGVGCRRHARLGANASGPSQAPPPPTSTEVYGTGRATTGRQRDAATGWAAKCRSRASARRSPASERPAKAQLKLGASRWRC